MATSPSISLKCVKSLFHRHAIFKGLFSKKWVSCGFIISARISHIGETEREMKALKFLFFKTQLSSGTIQCSLSKIQCRKKMTLKKSQLAGGKPVGY